MAICPEGSRTYCPPKKLSRKERIERNVMKGGNGESEANEVTLPIEPRSGSMFQKND